MHHTTTWNKNFIFALLVVTGVLLYLLAPILTPFLVGAILAYLGDPLVNKLTRLKVPRLLSVILVFLLIFLSLVMFILLLIPLIEKQLSMLVDFIPSVATWTQNTFLPLLKEHFGIDQLIDIDSLKTTISENWTKAGGAVSWILRTTVRSGMKLIEWGTNLVLIPVVTFYLLRDWNQVVRGIRNLIPKKIEPTVVKLAKECDAVLSAFFRGQLLVMLCLGVFYSIGLTLCGLQLGLIIGLLSGLFSIVPYLGFIIGIVVASTAALVQYGTLSSIICVFAVFIIGNILEGMFLAPNLVGDRIGLHPVAVIFAILAGGTLFGFFGILLALPVAAVIMVLLKHMHSSYRSSTLYKDVKS